MKFLKELLAKIDATFSLNLLTLLAFIGLVLYFRSLFNGFVGDDDAQILSNDVVQHLGNVFNFFKLGTFTSGGATGGLPGVYYKPFMTFCFALLYALFGTNAFGYHLFSLGVHICNVFLLFFLSRAFFKQAHFHTPQALSFVLSLIFLMQPALSDSVLYMANLQDLLVTTFLFVSLLLMQRMQSLEKIKWKDYLFLAISLFMGMISKEVGVIALALVVVYAWLFIRKAFKKILFVSVGIFLFYLFLRLFVAKIPTFNPLPFIPIHAATFSQRLMTIPFELFSYMRLVVFPQSLFVYQHFVVVNPADPRFALALPVVAVVIATLIYFGVKLKSKLYWFFLAWLFFGFVIVINLIPLDMTFAERWLYPPLGGILLAVFFILQYVEKQWKKLAILCALLLVIILPYYFIRTYVRSGDWKDNATLYSHDIKLNPYSYELLSDYAVALIDKKDYADAQKNLALSIQLSPQYWPAYSNMGLAYDHMGKTEMAKKYYRLAIDLSHFYIPYINLSELTFETEPPQNVVPVVRQALLFYPNNPQLLGIAAKTYAKLGQETQAKQYAERAVLLDREILTDPVIQKLLPDY